MKLLHDLGAVYTYLKRSDGEENKFLFGATGSNPIIKNFEK